MSFSQNKYQVVRSAISYELSNFLFCYFLNKRQVAKTLNKAGWKNIDGIFGSWNDKQVINTYSNYSDIAMETLLIKLKPIMQEVTNLDLVETYSYARIYKKGDILKKHKDRPSCQISTTLNLGGPLWPIFLEDLNNNEKKIIFGPGDMLIYRGCELQHWREEFDSNDCAQVFLHYNDKNSDLKLQNKYDQRPHLGLPSSFKKSLSQ